MLDAANILLFDLDGVLIHPVGYRAAVRASLGYIFSRVHPGLEPPSDEVPALLESIGVTSEWDMVALSLVMLFDAAGQQLRSTLPNYPLERALEWLAHHMVAPLAVPYARYIDALRPVINHRRLPAWIVLDAIQSGQGHGIFPALDGQQFVVDLLGSSRRAEKSLPVRLVQNYVLGHEAFEKLYPIPAPVRSQSFLLDMDLPSLRPDQAASLNQQIRAGELHAAAFTARPSLPPQTSTYAAAYSPEAEMGLELVGLADMPFIAYGHLEWLAHKIGGVADEYLKPAAIQPLAAIAAACGIPQADALLGAADIVAGKICSIEQAIPGSFSLHVFEDSSIGLIGARRAAELLQSRGKCVQVFLWGISTSLQKTNALVEAGARVYPDINAALRLALPGLLPGRRTQKPGPIRPGTR